MFKPLSTIVRANAVTHRRLLMILCASGFLSYLLRDLPLYPLSLRSLPAVYTPTARQQRELRDGARTVTLLTPLIHEPQEERWLDIAGNPYRESFQKKFSYQQAQISITYLREASSFMGVLVATGLKPSFAYQIKLRGDYQRDQQGYEKIGYVGRWRLPGTGTNYTDQDYEDAADRSKVEAYIIFDYFVTDEHGNARKKFCLGSSLHVLWNRPLNGGGARDTRRRVYEVVPNDPTYYLPPTSATKNYRPHRYRVTIAAENQRRWAKNRARIGEARLPSGVYQAELVLTEESFHSRDKVGGWWASVLSGAVSFTITPTE